MLIAPGKMYLTTRHGAKLVLAPDALDVYATMVNNQNAWDYHDFAICRNALLPGGVYYDVGANVGYAVVEMAFLDRGSAKTVGFEPNASLCEAIRESIGANDLSNAVQILECLLGDAEGEATMYVAPASIHSSAVADSNRPVKSQRQISMLTIDCLVTRGEIEKPTIVKMDVEGSEHLVFRGARNTFRSALPHIFLEYHASDDVGQRIWDEVAALARDASEYELFYSPQKDRKAWQSLVKFRAESDLAGCDGLFLRSRSRQVRDERYFEA